MLKTSAGSKVATLSLFFPMRICVTIDTSAEAASPCLVKPRIPWRFWIQLPNLLRIVVFSHLNLLVDLSLKNLLAISQRMSYEIVADFSCIKRNQAYNHCLFNNMWDNFTNSFCFGPLLTLSCKQWLIFWNSTYCHSVTDVENLSFAHPVRARFVMPSEAW